MSTDSADQKIENVLLVLVALFFVAALGFALTKYNSGPVGKVQGTVLSTRGIQGETQPTTQELTLKLTTGEVVFARTIPGIIANNGDFVFANSYKQAISGGTSYEVIHVERGR